MSTLKTNTITTVDGTGSLTVDRPLLGEGSSLTGVSPRNFIIDGDFTQWPEGTTARTIANAYGPALMYLQKDGDGAATIERSTDVPTLAQSSHSSKHSMLIKCTGTDASVASGAYKEISFRMTGTDYNSIHGKEVTISFWAKTAAANSGDVYCYHINKTGTARGYVHEFTATSSWQKFTHTVTIDDVATASDETGYVYFGFGLGSTGSTYQGTNNTWESGWDVATSGMNNFFDSTSNELYISQHMVTLGSSAPIFTPLPISTVKDQVEYYVQRYDLTDNSAQWLCVGVCSASASQSLLTWRRQLRVAPTVTSTAAATFEGGDIAAAADLNAINFNDVGVSTMRIHGTQGGSTWTNHSGFYITRDGTDTAWVMLDARH